MGCASILIKSLGNGRENTDGRRQGLLGWWGVGRGDSAVASLLLGLLSLT